MIGLKFICALHCKNCVVLHCQVHKVTQEHKALCELQAYMYIHVYVFGQNQVLAEFESSIFDEVQDKF